jgi:hypothetical protein
MQLVCCLAIPGSYVVPARSLFCQTLPIPTAVPRVGSLPALTSEMHLGLLAHAIA